MRRLAGPLAVALAIAFALGSCARSASPGGGPSPSPSSSGGTRNEWTLRYVLLDRYPSFAFCDPDYYPVGRPGGEQPNADDWWTRNHATAEARAILAHLGYSEPLDAKQRLAAYRDHKKLTVIQMTREPGGYTYALSISANGRAQPDTTVSGSISDDGRITEGSRTPRPGGCPICLEASARIATPGGPIDASRIRTGDLVYSVDGLGHRVAVRVLRVVRRAMPGPHLMIRLALFDGRVLVAAGAHPAVGGRLLRDLRAGERYDGSTIAAIGYVVGSAGATYDLLPASATGEYWADGILVGSTLR
jgi:hypothetical protein